MNVCVVQFGGTSFNSNDKATKNIRYSTEVNNTKFGVEN